MSLIYLLALCGFALVMLAVMVDTVMSVSRKPSWNTSKTALSEVITVDQRTQNLPFVGAERRVANAALERPERLKKSA
jgi:hypothetical protein